MSRVWTTLGGALARIAMVLAILEVGGHVGHRLVAGRWVTLAGSDACLAARAASAAEVGGAGAGTALGNQPTRFGVTAHPFTGFVQAELENVDFPVERNAAGFLDDGPLVRRRSDDRYLVGVTGGSVAFWTSIYGARALAEELESSPALAGRRVEVVRLALGGFKQPQQLMAAAWMFALGGELDALVDLDGFNEVALTLTENVPRGLHPHYPRQWDALVALAADPERLSRLARQEHARDAREAWEVRLCGPLASRSGLVQLAWQLRDRSLAAQERDAARRLAEAPPATLDQTARLAEAVQHSPADLPAEIAALWRRASIAIAGLCASHDVRYYHFLQPNQYVANSKPIGEAERRVALLDDHAYARGVVAGYPRLLAEAPALWQAGVRFFDLTALFADQPEPRYSDNCCHLNEIGYQEVARAVAGAIRADLERAGRAVAELFVLPEAVAFGAPDEVVPLAVSARYEDGVTADVTHPSTGTRYRVIDEAIAEVDPLGRVRPRREGETQVEVDHLGASLRVAVAARFAAVAAIEIDPPAFTLDAPLAPPAFRVVGRLEDGRYADLTADPRIHVAVRDPGVASLDAASRLVARSEGETVLEVRYLRWTASAPVRSRLGRVVTVGTGAAGLGGHEPRLDVAGLGAGGSSGVTFSITGVRGAAEGFLGMAEDPADLDLSGEWVLRGLRQLRLTVDGPRDAPGAGAAVLEIPLPVGDALSGRIVYARAVFADDAVKGGRSATPTVRLSVP